MIRCVRLRTGDGDSHFREGSTKFLKHGWLLDLVELIRPANVKLLLSAARDRFELTEYLIEQVPRSEGHRLARLDEHHPKAGPGDWRLQLAGQRVQAIKPAVKRAGLLEFGTERVGAADTSLVALLGASPGAFDRGYHRDRCIGDVRCRRADRACLATETKENRPLLWYFFPDRRCQPQPGIRSETARALRIDDVNAARVPWWRRAYNGDVKWLE